MPITKRELFIETIMQGPIDGENSSTYNQRLLDTAFGVIEAKDIDEISEELAEGIDISIPIKVSDPTVTEDNVNNAVKEHNTEVEATKAANQALIKGIATAVIAAGTTMAGGTPAIAAFLPVVKNLLEVLMKK